MALHLRREQKLLAGLLAVAILTLLYFSVGRQTTRTKTSAASASHSQPHPQPPVSSPEASPPRQQDSSSLLIRTDLYTISRVNASLVHNDVPLQISLLVVKPREHIEAKMPSVLLLHGHEQSAKLWEKMGTLQVLGDTGHRGYAVDLPGSGHTRLKGKLPHSEFIQAVMNYLELDRPVLVAPSTSGVFAFEYAFDDPQTMGNRLSGFIGLSPTHALAYRQEDFANFKKLYTVLVYGEKEDLPGEEAFKRFRLVPSARIIPMRNMGHLHFMKRPDIVNDLILDALKALED